MSVSLESVVSVNQAHAMWIARFGDEHHAYGDPYTGSALITRDGDVATVKAYSGRVITVTERRQLRDMLRHHGINRAVWERRGNNERTVEVTV